MPGQEKAVFRDCYNLLVENLGKPKMQKEDWENLKLQFTRLTKEKFTEIDDMMLCVELMGVICNHIARKQVQSGNTSV